MIRTATWLLTFLVFASPYASQVVIDHMSGPPPPLPGYPGFWRSIDVQGEITVLVRFRVDGTADSVTLQSSKLSGRWRESDWGSLEQEVFEGVKEYIVQWKTTTTPMPPEEVTVVYRIDPSLPSRQMNYLCTYGKYDLIERVEIVAAPTPK